MTRPRFTLCLVLACTPKPPTTLPAAEPVWLESLAPQQPPQPNRSPAYTSLTSVREVPLPLSDAPLPASLALNLVVEGECAWLDVSPVAGAMYVHWGVLGAFARVPADANFEPALIPNLANHASSRDRRIRSISGTGPEDLWFRVEGERMPPHMLLHGKSWQRFGMEHLYPWRDGAVLGYAGQVAFYEVRRPGEAHFEFDTHSRGPGFDELFHRVTDCESESAAQVFTSGDVLFVGRFCQRPRTLSDWNLVAGHWRADRVEYESIPHPRGEPTGELRMVAPGPHQIHIATTFIAASQHTAVMSKDLVEWARPVIFGGALDDLGVDREGQPWVVAGGIVHRRTIGGWVRLAPPERMKVEQLGVDAEVAWMITDLGGLWLRPPGAEAWSAAPIAYGLRAKRVQVIGSEVWVTAEGHNHNAILRSGPARPVFKCKEY